MLALGEADSHARVLAFLRTGLVLSALPIVISLYQDLPTSRVNYPFPVADFVVFFALAILKWTAYAFFFGLFFANIAGQTALAKGMLLFLLIAIPFGVEQLLRAAGLEELRQYLFWVVQLFVFCGVVGLAASDLKLLRHAGLHARDLKQLYRLPILSAFGSAAIAAMVPTVITILSG